MTKILVITCLPLVNMLLIPWFYQKLWFLILTVCVTSSVGFYRFVVKKINDKGLIKSKILSSVVLIISVCNLLITMTGYTTKFVAGYLKNKDVDNKFLLVSGSSVVIKGKVFISEYPLLTRLPAANAKLYFVDKKRNKLVSVFYTDIKGEFVSKLDDIPTSEYSLKIEHIDCKPYQTELLLYPGIVKELEIYLQKK